MLKTKNSSKQKLKSHVCNSYLVKSGIVYLTLGDFKYPQKLAFMFLNELSESFAAEL